jgi:hypothetical protein
MEARQGGDAFGSACDSPTARGRPTSFLALRESEGYRSTSDMSTTDRSNEGKACDAVLRHIEAREGATRRDLIFPEKEHHADPVELVCTVGTQRYALEHTRIEPFDGHIRLEAEGKRHFSPIMDRVADQLPSDSRFELNVPVGVMLGLNDRTARPIQDALADWILATAPGLPTARPGRYILPIQKVTPPGVPFAVSLHRWPREEFPYPFVIQHLVQGDVETGRLERLRTAYDKKLKKLLPWQRSGARAILILEEDDIFLTNHFVVVDALNEIEAARTERPDEVYLLSVFTSMWMIACLRRGDVRFYDMPVDDRFWETKPDQLVNVTGERRARKEVAAP